MKQNIKSFRKKRKLRIGIYVDESTLVKLDHLLIDRGSNRSEYIRELVSESLKKA